MEWTCIQLLHLKSEKVVPHNQEDVSKQLVNMTGMLFGLDNDQQSDILLAQLSQVGYIPSKVVLNSDPDSMGSLDPYPDPGGQK
jgi:hypothetical protein